MNVTLLPFASKPCAKRVSGVTLDVTRTLPCYPRMLPFSGMLPSNVTLANPLCAPQYPNFNALFWRFHPGAKAIMELISWVSEYRMSFFCPSNSSHQISRAQTRSLGTSLISPDTVPFQYTLRRSSGHLLQPSGTDRSRNSRIRPSRALISR